MSTETDQRALRRGTSNILQLQSAFTTIATGVTFWAVLGVSVAVMRIQEVERGVASKHQ